MGIGYGKHDFTAALQGSDFFDFASPPGGIQPSSPVMHLIDWSTYAVIRLFGTLQNKSLERSVCVINRLFASVSICNCRVTRLVTIHSSNHFHATRPRTNSWSHNPPTTWTWTIAAYRLTHRLKVHCPSRLAWSGAESAWIHQMNRVNSFQYIDSTINTGICAIIIIIVIINPKAESPYLLVVVVVGWQRPQVEWYICDWWLRYCGCSPLRCCSPSICCFGRIGTSPCLGVRHDGGNRKSQRLCRHLRGYGISTSRIWLRRQTVRIHCHRCGGCCCLWSRRGWLVENEGWNVHVVKTHWDISARRDGTAQTPRQRVVDVAKIRHHRLVEEALVSPRVVTVVGVFLLLVEDAQRTAAAQFVDNRGPRHGGEGGGERGGWTEIEDRCVGRHHGSRGAAVDLRRRERVALMPTGDAVVHYPPSSKLIACPLQLFLFVLQLGVGALSRVVLLHARIWSLVAIYSITISDVFSTMLIPLTHIISCSLFPDN